MLEEQLEQRVKSEGQYNTCVNLHNQFVDYLENNTKLDLLPLQNLKGKTISPEEKLQKRMTIPRSFTMEFSARLLAFLLNQIETETPLAGVTLGMLVMYCMGLRSSEMLARTLGELYQNICYIGTQKKGQKRTQTLKRGNSYRKLPVVSLLQEAANRRVQTLCRQLGIPREKALTYPVTGAASNASCRMEEITFAAEAREIFRALGVQDETIAVYSGMLAFVKARTAEQELSVCAYILRREFVTRLYNRTELPQEMIRYLADTGHHAPKPYLPDGSELGEARLALEHSCPAQGGAL